MLPGVIQFVRVAGAAALIALLAACTTPPPAATPGPHAGAPRPTVVPPHDAPGEVADDLPAPVSLAERPRPELLGGEVPREFQRGTASWYGPRFNGRRTASGERFDMREFTAAHRTLPFGTLVRVHSLVNGRDVDVRITDRGPYAGARIIDLSRAAAEELGMLGLGFKEVVLMVPESTPGMDVAPPPPPRRRPQPVKRAASSRPR
jgi:rare lipoprotein A